MLFFRPECSISLRMECSQFTFQMPNISIAHSSEEGMIWWGRRASSSWILDQGSWYNVTSVQNVKGKIFLCPHSLLSKNFLFLCLTRVSILWKICVYIHIPDHCFQIIPRVKHFYENREGWEGLTGYLLLRRCPEGGTKQKFHYLLVKQGLIATTVTSRFSSLLHSSRRT